VKDREVGVGWNRNWLRKIEEGMIGARWAGTHELGEPFEVSTLTAAAVKKEIARLVVIMG
jgi:hypothetical protein